MQDMTSEQNYKGNLEIDEDPYNRGTQDDVNSENTWLKHLMGNADVPLAIQKNKTKFKKRVSKAQIRALEAVREE